MQNKIVCEGWKVEAEELARNGKSWRKIADMLEQPKSTVSDHLRKVFSKDVLKNKHSDETYSVRKVDDSGEDNSRILLISDMHIPYHHEDTIAFLTHLKAKYNPTRVICLGDELDKHALSYHDSDPDLPSAGDELKKSLPVIQELFKIFPKMDIIESNHGSLVWRKAKTFGIPKHYIRSYNDVLGVDGGWKWSFDLTVTLPNGQKCYIHHGKTSNVIQLSQQMGMCAVQGHFHESFKIDCWGNPTGLYWGMQAGCLIDDDALAFNYNNVNIKRPVIGTGLIINSMPVLEPMVLDSNGRWVGD
jgi:predicted phosphodiesterase